MRTTRCARSEEADSELSSKLNLPQSHVELARALACETLHMLRELCEIERSRGKRARDLKQSRYHRDTFGGSKDESPLGPDSIAIRSRRLGSILSRSYRHPRV
jgi:hypothetical protein